MSRDGQQRAVTVDDVASRALTALVGLPGVRRAGLAVTEGGGRRLRFTASDRGGPVLDWCHIDAFDDVPLTAVVRSGRAVAGTLGDLAGRFPEFVAGQSETPTVALASAPIAAAGEVLGGVVVYLDDRAVLGDALAGTVADLAREAGEALLRARRRPARRPLQREQEVDGSTGDWSTRLRAEGVAGVPVVRRAVRDLLRERALDPETIDDALLCLSELVTNAVTHTAAPASVELALDEAEVRVAVTDDGSQLGHRPGVVDHDDALRVHGRGLQIVEALATRWGTRAEGAGTTVWFALGRSDRAG